MKEYKIKSKFSDKIYYFKFFDSIDKDQIWYTPTTESLGFDIGRKQDFETMNCTWEELRKIKLYES